MLDYAANAIEYWPMDKLRQFAAETAERSNADMDVAILSLLDSEDPGEIEPFWQSVEQNLRMGRLRLIFVSDSIPRELRRIVEFLNEQMDRTEVLAVEIKQFTGSGARVMAPRVLGTTEKARQRKIEPSTTSARRSRPWSTEEYIEHIQSSDLAPEAKSLVRRILDWGRKWEQEGILSLEGGKGREPSTILRAGRSNLLTLTGIGGVKIYYGFWRLPESITKQFRSELYEILGNSERVLDKEPDVASLLQQLDPDLKKFAPWLWKVASTIQQSVEDDI